LPREDEDLGRFEEEKEEGGRESREKGEEDLLPKT
jgi:hypothetical protein